MKIIYVISNIATQSKGNGGHYYSLLTTAIAIKQINDIQIINIGTHCSDALQNSDLKIINIVDKKLRNFKLLKELYKTIKNEKPNVLHAFDKFAYFYCRIIGNILNIPIILTKCGGDNPKYYFPLCKNLINYSLENQDYFRKHRKFKNTTLYFIPNRILPFKNDYNRINALTQKYQLDHYSHVFLRIARIGNAYKNSILQLINLIEEINKQEIRVCLLLIGSVEDPKILHEIEQKKNKNIFIENDTYFTQDSKQLINIADVVLGTGRSFMEAASLHKIMLAPIRNSTFPVLVTTENFEELFNTNFSERGILKKYDGKKNFQLLIEILKEKEKKKSYLDEIIKFYDSNFKIHEKLSYYNIIYKNLEFKRSINPVDTVLNYLFVMKTYFQSDIK